MIVALSAVFVVSLTLSVVLTPRSAPYAYYGLHTRAWELAAGGLLALTPAAVTRDRW
jgi:peptidoglycan/LPS O-acetylase OafA/YrhL